MEQAVYHVVLEGRKVGPYDRRTIVGMRIKNTLSSDHVLIDAHGIELTVGDLIADRKRAPDFTPQRTGNYSIVQATFAASMVEAESGAVDVQAFKGEVQARFQGDVLRIAGRYRKGFGWEEDRIKLLLKNVQHARIKGSQVELWLRGGTNSQLQRIALELFTNESAGEFAEWLPNATPWPGNTSVPDAASLTRGAHMLWVPVLGVAMVIGLVLTVLLYRRLY